MTLTTYNENLCKKLEPNVCSTKRRFEVLKIIRDNGIPTIVWLSPLLPFINDTKENLLGILKYCIEAQVKGIICFNIGMTLREGNREYYYEALDKLSKNFSDKYKKEYGNSYNVVSKNNNELMKLFKTICQQNNILSTPEECFKYTSELEEKDTQISLF